MPQFHSQDVRSNRPPVPAMPNDMVGRPCVYGHIIDEKNIAFFREHNPALEEWKSFDPDTLLCTTSTMLMHGPCHTYSVPVHRNGATAICWIYLDYRRHSSGRLVDKRPLNEPRIELEGILGISADTEPSWYLVAGAVSNSSAIAMPQFRTQDVKNNRPPVPAMPNDMVGRPCVYGHMS